MYQHRFRTFSLRFFIVFLLLATTAVLAGAKLLQRDSLLGGPQSATANPAKNIAGSIPVRATLNIAVKAGASAENQIRLADRKVYLQDYNTDKVVDNGLTQLDGKLSLTAPQPGYYRVCWSVENIDAGCSRPFQTESETVYLGELVIRTDRPFAYGKSLLHEARPCWLHDPFFEVNLSTRIDLFDSSNTPVGDPVTANVAGEYVVGLPAGDKYRLRSTCENTIFETAAHIDSGVHHIDLPLDNHAPRKHELAAFKDSRGTTRAPLSSVIDTRVLARDADSDPLEYTWKTLSGSGLAAGSNAKEEQWTLPDMAGLHRMYVMVRDGRGGYLIDAVRMQVGVPFLNFSGIAIDEVSRNPVANARVDVLGVSATTDSNGWFSLQVPELENEQRYPLNINHDFYATFSRVLDKSSRGNTFELIRTQITQHDPGQPIDVVDTSSSGPCGTGEPDPNGSGRPPLDPRLLAGRNLRLAQPDPDCRHRGARLTLPANALVYADQTPAQGPVRLSMATLNPARRTLPGDYRALDAEGRDAELVSFGALYVEFRDNLGNEVNLRNGVEATLAVPVSDAQAPVAQPDIPMWSYEEKSGFWREEQKGVLTNTPAGLAYVGNTSHFSTINMDVAGTDPANATCVRLELGASLNAWSNLVLRAYVPVDGTGVQVKETALDNDQYHAIYRIPYADPPAGNTLRLELRGELPSGELAVLLEDIIQTDLRPKMTGLDLWPDYPYTECGEPVVLEADPVDLPYYGDINATGRPAFLTGPYGSYLPADGIQTSADYYAAIDPGNTKTDLGSWWTLNGFGADGSGGTRASYLNHNDLGFGRDMHCVGNSVNYACYVTNYGLPDQNPANADDAENQNLTTQGATVTMEYDAADGDTAVSFYAYNGGGAGAPRITFADLDGLGPKPIPHLCMVCHGGEPSEFTVDNLVHDAAFREFDLPSFRYSGDRDWDYAPAPNTLTPAELSAFETLNTEVAAINPGNKIEALIDAWYAGAGTAPQQLNNAQVPPAWAGSEDTYRDLYGTTCRTCHIARPGSPDTAGSFGFSNYAVCGSPKIMPNAYITYRNFWSDLIRVNLYETATGTADCFAE